MTKQRNKRGSHRSFTMIRVDDGKGGATLVQVPVNSKAAGIFRTKQKQIIRAQREHKRAYMDRLKAVKKRYPIEQRAHMKIEDL